MGFTGKWGGLEGEIANRRNEEKITYLLKAKR
jgi:hypothetical protein